MEAEIEAAESLQTCIHILETSPADYLFVLECLDGILENLQSSPTESASIALALIQRAVVYLEQVHDGSILGFVGRPKVCIPRRNLEYALSLNFTATNIAGMFGVSVSTIFRRLREFNLSVSKTYSNIGDDELEAVMAEIIRNHPNTGYKRMQGFLLRQGLKICQFRVLQTLRVVDPIGIAERRSVNRALYRRQYFVEYAMGIWHIDTHHKLIRWGMIVRGGIDGKSRTIVYLDVGTDNTAASNFKNFMDGISRYGVPIRTRSDKGGENVDIARFMMETRGTGRASHICGRSVHNQRIERLWRDVHYGCLSAYRRVFILLEDRGYLNLDNFKHVALLQYIFVPRIRRSLMEFMEAWNRHPLSSENYRTPIQIMFSTLPPEDVNILSLPAPDDVSNEMDPSLSELATPLVIENYDQALSMHEMELLNTIDPLQESSEFGADLYVNALNIIISNLN